METRILLVEDDPKMQRLMQANLTMRGYQVQIATNGKDALQAVKLSMPNLILLDISLPEVNGLDVCREIRTWSTVPIILVTASDGPQTKIAALELGGDDYLTKPFDMGELVARIRAVLRRYQQARVAPAQSIEWDNIQLDISKREVTRDGQPLHLTKIEFELLKELATNSDKALTYQQLLRAVWGHGYDDVRPVHVHICNLRRKLEPGITGPRRIVALPGIGYRFRGSES